jgi:hypothetical protein
MVEHCLDLIAVLQSKCHGGIVVTDNLSVVQSKLDADTANTPFSGVRLEQFLHPLGALVHVKGQVTSVVSYAELHQFSLSVIRTVRAGTTRSFGPGVASVLRLLVVVATTAFVVVVVCYLISSKRPDSIVVVAVTEMGLEASLVV